MNALYCKINDFIPVNFNMNKSKLSHKNIIIGSI